MISSRPARTFALIGAAALLLSVPALAQEAIGQAADTRDWVEKVCLVDPATSVGKFLGRLHMALIHFPIGLLVAAGMVQLFAPNREPRPGNSVLVCLGLGAGSALLATWTGWIHQEAEPVRSTLSQTVLWHRWLGVFIAGSSLFAFLMALWARKGGGDTIRRIYYLLLAMAVGAVMVNGHVGGTLVHGEGYMLAPFQKPATGEAEKGTKAPTEKPDPPASKPVPVEVPDEPLESDVDPREDQSGAAPTPVEPPKVASIDYHLDVVPIIEANCIECHGPETRKAGLRLDTVEELLIWPELLSRADPSKSELLAHVTLPLEDEEHMPPDVQLSAQDIATLTAWISAGAPISGS